MSCIFSLPVLSFAAMVRKLLTTNRFPFYLRYCENLSLFDVNGKTNKRRVIGPKETCSSHTQKKSRMCYKTKDNIRQNTTRQQQINNNHDDRMREIALLVVKLLFLLGPSRVTVCFSLSSSCFSHFPSAHNFFPPLLLSIV